MLTTVIASDRTVRLDEKYTLGEAKVLIESMNMKLSLRRTFHFYGLHYVEDRSFVSRYRDTFGLGKTRGMYDITLHELRLYRDRLVGRVSRGYVIYQVERGKGV